MSDDMNDLNIYLIDNLITCRSNQISNEINNQISKCRSVYKNGNKQV